MNKRKSSAFKKLTKADVHRKFRTTTGDLVEIFGFSKTTHADHPYYGTINESDPDQGHWWNAKGEYQGDAANNIVSRAAIRKGNNGKTKALPHGKAAKRRGAVLSPITIPLKAEVSVSVKTSSKAAGGGYGANHHGYSLSHWLVGHSGARRNAWCHGSQKTPHGAGERVGS